MRKRLTSILLSVALVLTSADFTVFATEQNAENEIVTEIQETEEIKEDEEGTQEGVAETTTENVEDENDEKASSQVWEESTQNQETIQEGDSTESIESESISQTEEITETQTSFETERISETENEGTSEEETESITESTTEDVIDDSKIKVTSSNSFGKLLTKSMEEEILELEQTPENNISGIIIDGTEAIVEFGCAKEATLIVAIYEEAGIKMLASGKTEVTPQQVRATVNIDIDNMPKYFIARGYLVDTVTMQPLSSVYETPMYTREMQELLDKSVDDFDSSKVINFDDRSDNNFAVAGEDTSIISNVDGENIISELDADGQICIITNANEEITSLQTGDIFVYEYEENDILIIKIADIEVTDENDGTKTVTIYGQETTLEEAFEYLKIDTNSELDEAQIDTSETVEGVEYKGIVKKNETRALIDKEGSISTSIKFEFLEDKEDDSVLTGNIEFGAKLTVKVYLSLSYAYIEVKLEDELGVDISLKAKNEYYKKELLKKPIIMKPVTGVSVEIMPSFVIEASAAVTVKGKIKATIGFAYSTDEGLKNISSASSPQIEIKGEVEVFVGISLKPEIKILSKIAKASMEATIGGLLSAKAESFEATGDVTHECYRCLDGDISIKWAIEIGAEINIVKKLKVTLPKVENKYKVLDFYYSFDYGEFAFTVCPHHKYLVNVAVLDKNSKPVTNAYVEDGVNPICYSVDDNGTASFYLPAGKFTIKAYLADDKSITAEKKITIADKAKDIKIVLSGYETSSDTGKGVQMFDSGYGQYGSISEDETLYMWGNNTEGCLGIGRDNDYGDDIITVPQKVLEKVKQISLGRWLSTAVTDEGGLYIWGGTMNEKISSSPQYVMADVKQVELCRDDPFAGIAIVKTNGDLYMGGGNAWGRYGDGTGGDDDAIENSVSVLSPKKIMSNVKKVSLGYSHSGAIKENGDLYTWGSGLCGQLGNGKGVCDHSDEVIVNLNASEEENYTIYLPQKVLSNVKDISFGGNFSAAITNSGELYVWGCNRHGNLGNNTTTGSSVPIKIMDNVKSVSAGANHIAVVTNAGELYVWGSYYNVDGEREEKQEPVKIMSNIREAVASSGATAIITTAGELYVWGLYHNDSGVIPKTKIEIPPITSNMRAFSKRQDTQSEIILSNIESSDNSDDDTDSNPLRNAVYGSRIDGKAVFNGLDAGKIYNIYEIKSKDAEDILYSKNLLYIAQITADEKGNVSHIYEPREEYVDSILFAVGSNLSKPINPQIKNIQDAVIIPEPLIYTGQEQVVKIQVSYNDTILIEGVDFELSGVYKAIDTGEYAAEIKGIGDYTGTKSFTWRIYEKQEEPSTELGDILPEDVPSDGNIPIGLWIAGVSDCTYREEVIKPEIRVYDNKKLLRENADYTISYKDNTKVGTATIIVIGKGDYFGKETATFDILPADISGDDFYAEDFYVKIGTKAQYPIPEIYYMGTKLKNKKDFTIKYSNTSGIYAQTGEHSVTITGTGNYTGTKVLTLMAVENIVKKPSVSISKASLIGFEKLFTYTGKACRQDCTLFIQTSEGEKQLVEGVDYTVRYTNNIKAGTATVTYCGKNGYAGKLKKTYKIAAYDISNDYEAKINYENFLECVYAKGGSKPKTVITFDGKTMTEGADYTLSYKNNKEVYGSQMPCIVVNGKGCFKGKLTIYFTIKPQDLSKMTLVSCDKVYKGKAGNYKIVPKLMDLDGKLLSAGKDFDKNNISYVYENDVTLENGIAKKAGDAVEDTDIISAGTPIRITLGCGSGNNYEGTFTGIYRIVKADIKSAKVTIPNQTYTGKEIILDKSQITVTLSGTTLKPEDYDIIQHTDNVKKGKASVTIKGNGNYGGTKTVKFNIGAKGFSWWWK